jgi:hypothetical protein
MLSWDFKFSRLASKCGGQFCEAKATIQALIETPSWGISGSVDNAGRIWSSLYKCSKGAFSSNAEVLNHKPPPITKPY